MNAIVEEPEPECEFDGPWKEAIEWFFEPFLEFFFPEVYANIDVERGHEFLDKELERIAPDAAMGRGTVDKLAKVWMRDGQEQWLLIHVEVQSQEQSTFAERMYTYNHRLCDKYGTMPVSLAILGDDRPNWRPSEFVAGRWGCEVRFTFPTAKLLEYAAREVELATDSNPFAAVTLAHLKTLETRGDPSARVQWKLALVRSLYDRGLDKRRVRLLFKTIDWIMTLAPLREDVFMNEIHEDEKKQAEPFLYPYERVLLAQATLKGRNEAAYEYIESILDDRFGEAGVALMPRILLIQDSATLASLHRYLWKAPDLEAVIERLPANS